MTREAMTRHDRPASSGRTAISFAYQNRRDADGWKSIQSFIRTLIPNAITNKGHAPGRPAPVYSATTVPMKTRETISVAMETPSSEKNTRRPGR
jgi:hypothetical protein